MQKANHDKNKQIKVLFIASFYPPVASTNVPGAMRTIKFIRNLENVESHVLTTPPVMDEKDSALSHLTLPVSGEIIHRVASWDIFKLLLAIRAYAKGLLKKKSGTVSNTSSSQQVFKATDSNETPATSLLQRFKDFLYNLSYFPDQAGPWIIPAYRKGKKLVKTHDIDVIFATGSPWSGLIAGYLIGKATNKPVIIDFRDPWMNNPFHQSKGKLLDGWSARLEQKVVENAAAISLNTEPLKEDFLNRFPHLPKERFFVMPNGFDLHDFNDVTPLAKDRLNGTLTLCHAGFLYGVRDPAVLLDAIKDANKKLTNEDTKIRFRQIGDVQLAYDIRERYADMIGDGSLVIETPRPYKECLRALSSADWVVNVQPGTKTQVPSKLYDYLAIKRPILNITPRDGALGQLVSKYELGELFGFDEQEALSAALVRIGLSLKKGDNFEGYPASHLFDCKDIAGNLRLRISSVAGVHS